MTLPGLNSETRNYATMYRDIIAIFDAIRGKKIGLNRCIVISRSSTRFAVKKSGSRVCASRIGEREKGLNNIYCCSSSINSTCLSIGLGWSADRKPKRKLSGKCFWWSILECERCRPASYVSLQCIYIYMYIYIYIYTGTAVVIV